MISAYQVVFCDAEQLPFVAELEDEHRDTCR